MQPSRLSGATNSCSDSSAPSTVVAAAGRNGLGIRSVTWHSSVPPETEPPSRRRDVRSPPLTTIEEPSPGERQKKWLEQEVERLTDKSQGLEEQLLVAQSAAMAMASRIEQLEELVKVVGTGAAAALDAQCSYLQQEISQQDTALAEKQDSLAMLEELHARAMQRKETQVRGLQRKLFDATTQLRAQEQAMQMREERFAKLRTVYTDNQKLKARILKLTEEAEARETELAELRELIDVEVDRAAASIAAEEETCELYEGLAGELVGFAAHARAARRLLTRAHMKCPARELPSPLWEAGFVECMQLLNRMCAISNTNAAATDDDMTSCQTWTPVTSGGGTASIMCYSPRSVGNSTAYASTGPSSGGGTSLSHYSPRGMDAGGSTTAAGGDVYSTVHIAASSPNADAAAGNKAGIIMAATAPVSTHHPALCTEQNDTAAGAAGRYSPTESHRQPQQYKQVSTTAAETVAPPPAPQSATVAVTTMNPAAHDSSTHANPTSAEESSRSEAPARWALLGLSGDEVDSSNSQVGTPTAPAPAAAAAELVAAVNMRSDDSPAGVAAAAVAVRTACEPVDPAVETAATATAEATAANGPRETHHTVECTDEEGNRDRLRRR